MNLDFNDGRALLHAETPAEAYWMAGFLTDVRKAGYDARVETKGGQCTVQLPLVKDDVVTNEA